jgi:polysaccharide export outer membrane protein
MATRFISTCFILLSTLAPIVAQQPTDYVIGPQDVLTIAMFDQEDLGGKYPVDSDGTFTFPLIGRVKAGGLTLRQLEAELKRLLKDGFFTLSGRSATPAHIR